MSTTPQIPGVMKALVDAKIIEILVKTNGEQVYLDEKTRLSPKIAEMIAAINLRATIEQLNKSISNLRTEL